MEEQMSDKLVEALRTIIKQEVISELDARKLNEQNVIDEEGQFTESQIESIKDIVKEMMGGEIEFTIEVHT
jgi:hypothetical protein